VSDLAIAICPVSSNFYSAASRTLENCAATKFELSQAEVEEITAIVEEHGVVGDRYFGGPAESMRLWG
jgi:diketogulonate reductase-like aldo/keto reductase